MSECSPELPGMSGVIGMNVWCHPSSICVETGVEPRCEGCGVPCDTDEGVVAAPRRRLGVGRGSVLGPGTGRVAPSSTSDWWTQAGSTGTLPSTASSNLGGTLPTSDCVREHSTSEEGTLAEMKSVLMFDVQMAP